MSPRKSQHVFVYGTLKRGQCREFAWPRPPIEVRLAFVLGELYDLGDYPAMLPGGNKVAGEVWSFEHQDVESTLRALDKIEGYRGEPDDLYRRVLVDCCVEKSQQELIALTYQYAKSDLDPSLKIEPTSSDRLCTWPQH